MQEDGVGLTRSAAKTHENPLLLVILGYPTQRNEWLSRLSTRSGMELSGVANVSNNDTEIVGNLQTEVA